MFKHKSGACINIKGEDYEVVSNKIKEEEYIKSALNKNYIRTFYLDNSITDGVDTHITYENAVELNKWLTEMIKIVEQNREEDNNMSKKYTFIEMLQEYENGYEGKFRKTNDSVDIFKNSSGEIIFKHVAFPLTERNMKANYIKVEEPVSFEKALEHLKKGKKVRCEYNNNASYYTKKSVSIMLDKILNGKWYLEE